MKKILSVLAAVLLLSAQILAVTPQEVCGQYDGDLNIDGQLYPSKSIYLLPGVTDNTLTFVLPDFMYGKGKLGNIVLPNIPMDATGKLTLENATLYLDSISERATITIINGLQDGGTVYNSIITPADAMVILSIEAQSLPEAIYVLFVGQAAKNRNYVLTNGGFEGDWTNAEPQGWHSFNSATGLMVDFIKNDYQFTQSSDVRPGTTGSHSALLSSTMALGVKANGNCTNGQVNAGSSTADDAAGNYNFSDPTNEGFCTPFNGHPDSIVFWAKYQPADRDASNPVNLARMNTVITTNARYQDPEVGDAYTDIKIGSATTNYAATSAMGWQRIAVPFEYVKANESKAPAYILTTFSTNYTPGGGSSYTTGGTFNKTNVLDSVYLDDVEIIYNNRLQKFTIDGQAVSFAQGVATLEADYCDDCAKFAAKADGYAAQTFLAFDADSRSLFIYIIGDNYAQTGKYNLYTVRFADSNVPGAIEMIGDQQSATQWNKVIRNGAIYLIAPDGTTYSIQGTRLD